MNGDITAQIEKARQSLDAAALLLRQGFAEFGASRAYYAMFYRAEALLASRNQSYSSHAAVLAAYGREFPKTRTMDPKYHRWLIDLQDMRTTGDYGIGTHFSSAQVEAALVWAQEFIQAGEHFLGLGDELDDEPR